MKDIMSPTSDPPMIRPPVSEYFMAVLSALFVWGGVVFVAFALVIVLARVIGPAGSPWVTLAIGFVPLLGVMIGAGLGMMSGWQTIQLARKKAVQKADAERQQQKSCPGCGEPLEAGLTACPMCGKVC